MVVVLCILSGLLCLILVLLSLPIELSFSGEKYNKARFHFLFGIGGWYTKKISLDDKKKKKKSKKKPQKKKRKRIKKAFSIGGQFLGAKGFKARCLKLVLDLVHSVHWKETDIKLVIGLDDPADLGILSSYLYPFIYSGILPERLTLEYEPDFTESRFDFEASGQIRFIPIVILYRGLTFVFSLPMFRGVCRVIRKEVS